MTFSKTLRSLVTSLGGKLSLQPSLGPLIQHDILDSRIFMLMFRKVPKVCNLKVNVGQEYSEDIFSVDQTVNYHRQENGLMYYGILDVMDLKLENLIFNCDCLDTMDVWKMI